MMGRIGAILMFWGVCFIVGTALKELEAIQYGWSFWALLAASPLSFLLGMIYAS